MGKLTEGPNEGILEKNRLHSSSHGLFHVDLRSIASPRFIGHVGPPPIERRTLDAYGLICVKLGRHLDQLCGGSVPGGHFCDV